MKGQVVSCHVELLSSKEIIVQIRSIVDIGKGRLNMWRRCGGPIEKYFKMRSLSKLIFHHCNTYATNCPFFHAVETLCGDGKRFVVYFLKNMLHHDHFLLPPVIPFGWQCPAEFPVILENL